MNKFHVSVGVLGGSLIAYGSYQVYSDSPQQGQDGFLQDQTQIQFLEWMNQYGKSYQTQDEFDERFKNFQANLKAIQEFEIARSALRDIGREIADHELGLNQFADWSNEQYRSILGFEFDATKEQKNVELFEQSGDLPDSINWVEEGKVTDVKDQGSCGSCWSFSTTGSIESAYWIKNKSQILLSEQQLVDCSIDYGNNGCGGGLVEYAYHYATENPLETEAEYPYKAKNQQCQATEHEGDVTLTSFKDVQRFDPVQLAQALQLGPVSIGVDASGIAFKFYKNGIIKRWCGDSIDHAVLLVGYGTDKGTDYWLVKNSWNAGWGENGYFRVLRDMTKHDTGMCGILQTPSYPIL